MPSIPCGLRPILIAALAALLATSPPAGAQTAAPRRIAYLGTGPSESVRVCMNQVRRALQESGWSFDGQLALEWNDAGNDPAQLTPMAQAIVASRPDILIAT